MAESLISLSKGSSLATNLKSFTRSTFMDFLNQIPNSIFGVFLTIDSVRLFEWNFFNQSLTLYRKKKRSLDEELEGLILQNPSTILIA